MVNLVGNGPIRYMYNPSLAGDANCYSSATPTAEVHAAAGPGNHWFYLLAEGTNPTDGQPTSPTCNGSTLTGIGIQKAEKIMYNAMLMKTSSSSYLKYRTWTLTAAKNLYGATSCTEFNAVKAAWDAVSVPAQAGDPTCSTGGGGGAPTGQLLANPGFESGAVSWTGTAGPITNNTGRPARTGTLEAVARRQRHHRHRDRGAVGHDPGHRDRGDAELLDPHRHRGEHDRLGVRHRRRSRSSTAPPPRRRRRTPTSTPPRRTSRSRST